MKWAYIKIKKKGFTSLSLVISSLLICKPLLISLSRSLHKTLPSFFFKSKIGKQLKLKFLLLSLRIG